MSVESLSLKLSGDQLTERRAEPTAARLVCAVHYANKSLEQVGERLLVDRARATWKGTRDPIGGRKSPLSGYSFQVPEKFVG